MNVSKDGKTLYFSDDEIDEETNGEKRVFVTKRINGKESHTKATKIKKNSQKQEKNGEDIFSFDNEIVIGVDLPKKEEKKQNHNEKKNKVKQRKETKKKNKKKKSHKKFAAFLSVIILVLVIIILALTAPIFNITDIQVEGNEQISDATILSLSRTEKRRKYF